MGLYLCIMPIEIYGDIYYNNIIKRGKQIKRGNKNESISKKRKYLLSKI